MPLKVNEYSFVAMVMEHDNVKLQVNDVSASCRFDCSASFANQYVVASSRHQINFVGDIDEFKIYDTAISQNTIMQQYNLGKEQLLP